MSIVLEGPIADAREREVRWLFNIADTVSGFGEDGQNDRTRIQRNANDLRDMFFLVVVIGEFNAGKSSFINAMLRDEVLPMGITPTTEMIELIRYSKTKSNKPEIHEEDALREWSHPNTGAPGVVIVDTPGTGSVFEKHERVAKGFLSRSDLVIFVLSAKRAFAQTEKMYLQLARDYGKKIILVINQADLLDKKEQKEVYSFVKQQVSELLNLEPPIFIVSAKKALAGNRNGGLFNTSPSADESGIDAVREHLLQAFRRTPPAKQKLLSQLDFGNSMVSKYLSETQRRLDLVVDDERQAKQLREELGKQAETLTAQLDTSMRELDRVFEEVRGRGRKFIADNLSFSGARMLSRSSEQEVRTRFEQEVVGTSLQKINAISEDYVNAVVDSSRRYWRSIIDRLSKMEALLKEQIASPDAGSYSDQRLALQEAIAIADKELRTYTDNNLAEKLNETFSSNMSGFTLSVAGAVGGIVAIIVGVATPGALTATAAGVALGLIAGPVLLVGGGALAFGYWRKLQRDAYNELDTHLEALRQSYRQALQDLTDRERSRLLQYGQQILSPVFSRLEVVADTYRAQQTALKALEDEGKQLREDIERIQIITE
jgi:small GTP-binding protein